MSNRSRRPSRIGGSLERLGDMITSAVGTMWTAIAFACLSLISLPAALATADPLIIVAWVAQTFLQLVLLPIIMVGQNAHSRKAERRDNETHAAVMAAHRETHEILTEIRTCALKRDR